MLTAHELLTIGPKLPRMEATSFFDHAGRTLGIFFPFVVDGCVDAGLTDVGMTVDFDAAMQARYVPKQPRSWSAFVHQDFTARALGEALPRVLLRAAVGAYTRHLQELEHFCNSRIPSAGPEQRAHLERKLRDIARMRAKFVDRIPF